ncbi:MAG TPA: type II secretion system F family protein [Chlamydiales bacterium]|jgi:general secretion pathway protein F/type IV pilus assembly protein PilC
MPLYKYEALSNGKKISGAVTADSLHEAKQQLLKQSIFLTQIKQLPDRSSKSLLKKKELLHFVKELSRLLKAGLPLYESLLAMEEKYRGHKLQTLLLDLCEQLRGGTSFSKALGRHPATFDPLFVAMIGNAEKTGNLFKALEDLAFLLTKQVFLRKQLVNALLYPSFLFGFCFLVLNVLLFYVIPSIEELFEGRALHPMTQIVFGMSHFAHDSAGILLLIGSALFSGVVWLCLFPKDRRTFFKQGVRLPLLRQPLSKAALVRFCRASSTLLDGGIPIVDAFSQARAVMRHPPLEELIEQAERAISQGKAIYASFQNHKLVPPLVPRMLAIAQEGGNLPSMLRQIAEIYEEDLERSLTYFSTVAQPALLLVLGVIVGFILLSVLVPLTDVSSFT